MSTAVEARPNIESLREQETSMASELEAVKAWLAEQPEKQKEAREAAFYTKGKRPLALLNSPLQKLIDAEQKAVAKQHGLEADLAAVRSVLEAETQRRAEESLVEVREQDETFREQQTELVKEAGLVFASLVAIYGDLVECFEQHDQARDKVRRKLPPNLAELLDAGGSFLAVSPTPVTFASFLRMLREAATDSNYRAGVAGGGVRFDERDVLVRAVPDLRGKIRRAELSGYTNRSEA